MDDVIIQVNSSYSITWLTILTNTLQYVDDYYHKYKIRCQLSNAIKKSCNSWQSKLILQYFRKNQKLSNILCSLADYHRIQHSLKRGLL